MSGSAPQPTVEHADRDRHAGLWLPHHGYVDAETAISDARAKLVATVDHPARKRAAS